MFDNSMFIANDMLGYLKHKKKQIEDSVVLESNFNKKAFDNSQQRWITNLSKAIGVFNGDNDELKDEYMSKVDDIENEVFYLVSDD